MSEPTRKHLEQGFQAIVNIVPCKPEYAAQGFLTVEAKNAVLDALSEALSPRAASPAVPPTFPPWTELKSEAEARKYEEAARNVREALARERRGAEANRTRGSREDSYVTTLAPDPVSDASEVAPAVPAPTPRSDADKRVSVLLRNAAALLESCNHFDEEEDEGERLRLLKALPAEAERFYPLEESLRDMGFPNKLDGSYAAPALPASAPTPDAEVARRVVKVLPKWLTLWKREGAFGTELQDVLHSDVRYILAAVEGLTPATILEAGQRQKEVAEVVSGSAGASPEPTRERLIETLRGATFFEGHQFFTDAKYGKIADGILAAGYRDGAVTDAMVERAIKNAALCEACVKINVWDRTPESCPACVRNALTAALVSGAEGEKA